ncbi:MAG: type II toxin-antitoxin system HicB family antitoxin [Candidatus Levyibacteriota bacterium]
MKHRVANYTVVIEKQKRMGTDTWSQMAFVPLLGIATEADTVEEVEIAINDLIQFHIDTLAEEGESIPVETENPLITRSEVSLPRGAVIQ